MKDFETPQEASSHIYYLYRRAELVNDLGNEYANTAPNIAAVTDGGRVAALRDMVTKEEIGTIWSE
ncbi:MAG: hypothetical protein SA339_13845 [Methanomassiliicoccus sp.]|nr:hypothetical protein [Methanomassiliicoccus sp.]